MNDYKLGQIVVSAYAAESSRAIYMPAALFLRFLKQASETHAMGLKSYGVFLSRSDTETHELRATDVFFCDPRRNRRNDSEHRPGFEAQGAYFRRHDDAGFVADPSEIQKMQEMARCSGNAPVGLFHSHRRQPANFSLVDYRLHNPFFSWHVIVSMRDPEHPVVQPFVINKPFDHHGLDADTIVEDEGELPYSGPEVAPARLVIEGGAQDIEKVRSLFHYNEYYVKPPGYQGAYQ